MAAKSFNKAIQIDSAAIKIISNQATQLIKQIQRDIKNEKELSKETSKTCNTILQNAQKQYIRIQIEFVEETKILITKTLEEPDIRLHETWLHVFDMFATRCEQVAGPILQVLNSVALESNRLKHKYYSFVAGATTSSVVSTVLIGGLIVHYLPATVCGFTLTAGGVVLAASGALLAAGLAIACIIGAMKIETIRAVYDKCTSE
ncbi:unnamed protein product [Adineta steineri]|uniref:Uncharacterized protein n=1 Tax=Adineta steineri TaxID=433720 RepID=A0A816DA25_9BILA|nr:unnamed protein product [Adineta steineri]CAF1631759.1 unnamed protein product [Adineta steineri]